MNLYRLARLLQDLKAISSGSPKRMARRGKNKIVGRALGRWLWR
jgi:hypothetical protein